MLNCEKCNLSKINSRLGFIYDRPLFSFNYMTTNKNFNFEYKDKALVKKFSHLLIQKITELENKFTIKQLFVLHNNKIFESFCIGKIYFKPSGIIVSNDTKVYVFRVTDNYRMICLYSDIAPIFHVIGFDFNFSAYDHGS